MPKLKFKLPSYRPHKASGQAVVTLNGKDIYLGPYGSPESKAEYDRLIQEWLASHHQLPPRAKAGRKHRQTQPKEPTINEIFAAYWEHAQRYYVKNGQPTSEIDSIKRALKPMVELYGTQPARTFGPLAMKACRQRMIDEGWRRGAINKHVSRCKRFFKWAVENELVPSDVCHALSTVGGLRRGRTAAKESQPIRPVSDELVDPILPYLNRYVRAMVQLQRLTGMRPCEVTIIRTRDVDKDGSTWAYRPHSHKTEHHDRQRVIYLGPRAQQTIQPFLLDDANQYIFSPKLVLAEHRAGLRASRKTPLTPSQRGRCRKPHPRKQAGEHYTTRSYHQVIRNACDRAFPIPKGMDREQAKKWRREHRWSPNRLRHTAATQFRKEFGIEAARVVLGHQSAVVTEIYAEIDQLKAADVMGRVG